MPPPVGYICHRCNVPGHFIQHCPTNGDPSYDIRKLKPPTERLSAPPAKDPIPPELHCPVCKALMKDAAFTKCCFRSLCDKCIRGYVSTKSACLCGSMKMSVDDIIPNVTLRELINRIRESAASSREKNFLDSQAEHAGSTNNEQAKEEPKKFLDSNYGAVEVDDVVSQGTLESNKRKLVGGKEIEEETATQDYGTQNCGGMPLSSSDCPNFLGRQVAFGTDPYMAAPCDALLTGLVPQDPSLIHAYTNPDSRRKRVKMSA
ncbi:E3 ubiquitin ligase PQT3-like isoform X2 [Iris pallida]|uniref:E3 ubiquitin ligase PQT3-like isoform X2 n=1 Tax=Iris pallida TaxID=29817 RepID=A0AAX6FBE2_IRIPA|nr:E3 ubiquitin ligase PQT3-like isoform X2 [Iris pallida]